MSLSQIQEVYQLLEKINKNLADIELRTDKVGAKVKSLRIRDEIREVEYLFYRLTSILNRMGLPAEVDRAIAKIQQLILVIRMLHTAMIWMELGTPYGLAIATIGVMSLALSFSNMWMEGY